MKSQAQGDFIIKVGLVESINDEYDGGRIKVRLVSDGNAAVDDLPYSIPLLPRTIQSIPKVGEAVFVFCSQANNDKSNRLYIGPILSQPQQFYNDQYATRPGVPNTGRPTTLFENNGSFREPLPSLSKTARDIFNGALPSKDAVALVGRKGEDVYLADDEVIIRAGGRIKDQTNVNPGYVQVNRSTPAVQFNQYKPNGFMGVNSVSGMCAGKIGLFSNDVVSECSDIYKNGKSDAKFMTDEELRNVFEQLHPLPYGDVLIEFLSKFLQSYFEHTHKWANEPLTMYPGSIHEELQNYNMKQILTNDIYIS